MRPDVAGDRHLGERDREAAVADVVHTGDRAVANQLGDDVVHVARAIEIGGGRHAAVETVHDRGPLRTAELRPHRRRRTTMSSPVRNVGGRRRVASVRR